LVGGGWWNVIAEEEETLVFIDFWVAGRVIIAQFPFREQLVKNDGDPCVTTYLNGEHAETNVAGHLYHARKYLTFAREEWRELLITVVVAGILLSFNDWGDKSFELFTGLKNLAFAVIATFCLFTIFVMAQKLTGIFYGIRVSYAKDPIGLLVGVLITIISLGYLPFFLPGTLTYETIPNLRIGRFRSVTVKKWEAALIACAGPFAMMLLTIPFGFLKAVTGLELFHSLIIICVLLALYALIPLPMINTKNPYTAYMSRMEMLEGSTMGYDIIWASPAGYFFFLGFTLCFSAMALLFAPSWITIGLSILLGVLGFFWYKTIRDTKMKNW